MQINKSQPEPGMIEIDLPLSKSVLNRELILAAQANIIEKWELLSLPDDAQIMLELLSSKQPERYCSHAGTVMRFGLSYLATRKNGEYVLMGSERMHERPISELVSALNQLGAGISYQKNEGFPPLHIRAKGLDGGEISINGNVSSQFISSLLLSAPSMNKGLSLHVIPPIVSWPYIKMSLDLMEKVGVDFSLEDDRIHVPPQRILNFEPSMERDWSSAAFFFGLVALGAPPLSLKGLAENSLQGDKELIQIFSKLGVKAYQNETGIMVEREGIPRDVLDLDLIAHPDLAQPIALTCAGLGIKCTLSGLRTLKFKETDRIEALHIELAALGLEVTSDGDSIRFHGEAIVDSKRTIPSYGDHRMTMSMAMLTMIVDKMTFEDEAVVNKSFPGFWSELKKCGSGYQILKSET